MKDTFKNTVRDIKKYNFAIYFIAISTFLGLSVFFFMNILNPVYDKNNSIYNISNLKEMNKSTLDILSTYQISNANENISNAPEGRINPFAE